MKKYNYRKSYDIGKLAGKNACIEKFMLEDDDGYKFSVNLIEHKKSRKGKILIIPPGLCATKENSSKAKLITPMIKNKVSVLIFDAYGHGESEGRIFDYTMSKVINEINIVIKFLNSKKYREIIIFGSSVPAFATIVATAINRTSVSKLVIQSPVINLDNYFMKVRGKDGLRKYEQRGYFVHPGFIGRRRIGYNYYLDAKKYNIYKKYIPQIKAKTLIIAAGKDQYLNVEDVARIAELIKNKEFHLIENADHVYSDKKSRAELENKIINFIIS